MTRIYTTGCFELFHIGHLRLLERAKAQGSCLVVGVTTDDLMRQHKRPPVVPWPQRAEIVRALRCVDLTVPNFGVDVGTLRDYGIDRFVVGSTWQHPTGGSKWELFRDLAAAEIEVVVLNSTPGISTSILKERCKNETSV